MFLRFFWKPLIIYNFISALFGIGNMDDAVVVQGEIFFICFNRESLFSFIGVNGSCFQTAGAVKFFDGYNRAYFRYKISNADFITH